MDKILKGGLTHPLVTLLISLTFIIRLVYNTYEGTTVTFISFSFDFFLHLQSYTDIHINQTKNINHYLNFNRTPDEGKDFFGKIINDCLMSIPFLSKQNIK